MPNPYQEGAPLAVAEAAIESAVSEAWRRHGAARTMGAWLSAANWLGAVAAGRAVPATACQCPGLALELARIAGLQAVRAAAADDDMGALQAELVAALDALAAA